MTFFFSTVVQRVSKNSLQRTKL